MTAQVSDAIRYQGRDFSLVAFSDGEPFIPADFGYRPIMASTACYRGYLCGYAVRDGALFLDSLRISHQDADEPESTTKRPPPLQGVEAEPAESTYAGRWLFSNIGLPLAYSGGLLIGNDFIESLYVHMGFPPAWKYNEVHELVFENGQLIFARDLSERAAQFRQASNGVAPDDWEPSQAAFEAWVKDSFRRDYFRNK